MNPTHIIQLQAENVKRLRAVSITPAGHVIVVGGDNGEGKSSLLDSIAMGLGGKDQIPPEPVRRGARKATVILDLGDVIVKRTFRPNGGTSLTVEGKDGQPFNSPQAVLDRLTSRRTFDPLAFLRLGEDAAGRRKQAETLRGVAKLDFTALDEKRAALVLHRTEINRDFDRETTRFESLPQYPDAPAKEISVVEVSSEIEKAQTHNQQMAAIVDIPTRLARDQITAEQWLSNAKAELEVLETQVIHERDTVRRRELALVDVKTALAKATLEAEQAAKAVVDLAPLRRKLAEAELENKAVVANLARADAEKLVKQLAAKSEKLSRDLEDIDEIKRVQLEAAKLPIPNLGFTEDGILYNGLPLEQASQAEQMRVSVAIAAALNPTLRVMLVRDGSLLDANSLAMLAKLAEEFDLQVWLERVGHGPECSVVITDGAVEGAGNDKVAEEPGPELGGDS